MEANWGGPKSQISFVRCQPFNPQIFRLISSCVMAPASPTGFGPLRGTRRVRLQNRHRQPSIWLSRWSGLFCSLARGRQRTFLASFHWVRRRSWCSKAVRRLGDKRCPGPRKRERAGLDLRHLSSADSAILHSVTPVL